MRQFSHSVFFIVKYVLNFCCALTEIEFRMPLRLHSQESSEDTGYETLDSPDCSGTVPSEPEDVDGEEEEQWLESLGVEAAEIRRINCNQVSFISYLKQNNGFSLDRLKSINNRACVRQKVTGSSPCSTSYFCLVLPHISL